MVHQLLGEIALFVSATLRARRSAWRSVVSAAAASRRAEGLGGGGWRLKLDQWLCYWVPARIYIYICIYIYVYIYIYVHV